MVSFPGDAHQWHIAASLRLVQLLMPAGCIDGAIRRRVGGVVMQLIARAMYSNPPMMGAHIVSNILGDADMKRRWYAEVKGLSTHLMVPVHGTLRLL